METISFLKRLHWSLIQCLLFQMLPTRDGRGSYFFHGAGRGGARPKIYGSGQGGEPPLPTVRGGARKGSKSAGLGGAGGAGNILRVLNEIICCSKGNLNLHCIK